MAFAFIFSDVGVGEWFVLLAVLLIVVGPKRLPEAARKFGRVYSRLRRSAEAFRRELMEADAAVGETFERTSRQTADAFCFDDSPTPSASGAPSTEKPS